MILNNYNSTSSDLISVFKQLISKVYKNNLFMLEQFYLMENMVNGMKKEKKIDKKQMIGLEQQKKKMGDLMDFLILIN